MKRKSLIAIILIVIMVLSACSTATKPNSTPTGNEEEEEVEKENGEDVNEGDSSNEEPDSEEDGEFITVIDMNDREVKVPKEINSVALTALPLPSLYALCGAPIENLKGIHPGSTSAIENSIMGAMYPELVGINDGFIEGQEINIEELLKIDPDVVIYWAEYENQYEAMTGVGIPCVGVKGVAGGSVVDTLKVWLDILGQVFGTTGNTAEVLEYSEEAMAEVESKVSGLSEDEKPKVLYIYNHSSEQISAAGSNFYGGFWIESSGGINVAAELDQFGDVNMEQIYEWDPEIIVLTTFTETMPEDMYNNTIEGQDWSEVSAVKNGKVYKEPLGIYRWFVPCGDTPLMVKWMAQKVHPEIFDYDMIEEIKEYYQKFYGYEVEDEQAQGILDASPDAAKGTSWNASSSRK